MSIMNVVLIDAHRALVAVDTAALEIDPATGAARSFIAEKAGIHGGTVAASRGNLDVLGFFLSNMRLHRRRVPFDMVLRELPQRLADALRQFEELAAGGDVPALCEGTEFVLAGFDEVKDRVRAVVATHDGESWQVEEVTHGMAAPGVFDQPQPMDTPSAMLAVAGQQAAEFRRRHPDAPIGGELIVYQITPARVDMMNMGKITQ